MNKQDEEKMNRIVSDVARLQDEHGITDDEMEEYVFFKKLKENKNEDTTQ